MEDREILLRLRRHYSSNEAVAACNKEIARLGFELGVEKSEVAELKDKLSEATSALFIERKKSADVQAKLKTLEESLNSVRALGRAKKDLEENLRLRKEIRGLAKKFNNLRYFVIGNRLTPPYDAYLLENNL
jgi:predicted  nucleic acid-binding Zn-ribbon protein